MFAFVELYGILMLLGGDPMLHHKAYKFRIYPTEEQKILISKTIGCSRFVFNFFLGLWQTTYQETGKGLNYNTCSAMLPDMKKMDETIWLKEVDSISLQSSLKNLSDSYNRFFKKQNGRPSFKSKRNPVQSYTTKYVNNNISLLDRQIKLPKLGLVKYAKSREVKGRVISVTVRLNVSGKYFVSILCEESIKELKKVHTAAGLDLGISHFVVLSDGIKHNNDHDLTKIDKALKREQRKLSHRFRLAKDQNIKLSDAKNYQKQKLKVARLYEKVTNQRNDFLNKLSTDIIKNHDIICIEDLNVKSMLANSKLAKNISNASWSEFVSKLEYKAKWYGKTIVKVGRFYPSTRLCSSCNHNDGKKPLSIRKWTCSVCGSHHDRDINASKNILIEGLRILSEKTTGTVGIA